MLIDLIFRLKESIRESLEICKFDFGLNFDVSKINIEFPERKIYGELSTNAALVFSKKFLLGPLKLAGFILKNFCKPEYIEKIEIAPPGFINFFLNKDFYIKVLLEIDNNPENYGRMPKKNKRVLVEFVSANPTGPMHIGNARLGALGDSLSEALKFAGFEVYKEFYVNDAGNQIQKFAESLATRYLQIYNSKIEFPEDGYHGDDIKKLANNFAGIHGDNFLNSDKKILKNNILDYALPENINNMKIILLDYKIEYDNWFHESSLYNSGEISSVLNKLGEMGACYIKDDAVWFRATEFGAQKDEVLVRSNGIPTYFAADIAYHVNKFLVRNFDICVDFLGADHQGHIPRMHAAMKCFGIDSSRLIFVVVQLVRLVKDGKAVVMSKRSGQVETLKDFIEQINVDCSRFIFNMQDANSAMDFDIDLAVKNDNNNPVYYVKYANARIKSILKQFNKVPDKKFLKLELLDSKIERELIFELSKLPYIIQEVSVSMDSTKIARYVLNLASIFHRFYNTQKVNSDNLDLSNARYFLCLQISRVIKIVLDILKIDIPDCM